MKFSKVFNPNSVPMQETNSSSNGLGGKIKSEDKIVKNFLKEKSGALAGTSRHLPQQLETPTQSTFHLINKKVIKPTIQEVNNNRRARSARLRAAVRTSV